MHLVCLFTVEEKLNLVGHKEVCGQPPSTALMVLASHSKNGTLENLQVQLIKGEGRKEGKNLSQISKPSNFLTRKTKEKAKESKDQC